MTKCISGRELNELGEGLVTAYLRNSGAAVLASAFEEHRDNERN